MAEVEHMFESTHSIRALLKSHRNALVLRSVGRVVASLYELYISLVSLQQKRDCNALPSSRFVALTSTII